MAEEVDILSMIRQWDELERVELRPYGIVSDSEEVQVVIQVLRKMLDFLRDKKLREGSRLDYLIGDLVEMAQDAMDIYYELQNMEGLSRYFYEEIQSIKIWLGGVKMRITKFHLEGKKTETPMGAENVGEGDEEDLVGLEKNVEELLRQEIRNEIEGLQFSIVSGMVGIGKTTLVRRLYNNTDVVHHFKRRLWVSVSSDLSHKEVLMKLIQQVVDSEKLERDLLVERIELLDNRSLQQMLRQCLQGMPYFIVLEDWPNEMRLQSVLNGLPDEDNGSRLLLTTRSHDIRAFPHYPHEMRMEPLDSDKSWQLFLKTIFGGNKLASEHKFPKKLEKKAREVLAKCGGVPLAIKEVGRQLAEKRRLGNEWEQLLESVGFGSAVELLECFYHELDLEMKSCFLHLACFKENTTIRAEKLIHILAVDAAVSQMDLGNPILDKLVKESIVDAKYKTTDDRIKCCRINPILHMLSIKKAEEIGFEILSNNRNNRLSSQSPRHRVVICSREKFNYSMNQDNKHLVSLFFRGGGYVDPNPSYWKSFEELKILDFEGFGLKNLPESIGTISMELRYLGLRNSYIRELPQLLECLKKLEVLDISLNFMVKVPDIIWEMESLRHLYMSDVICQKPLKMDTLKSLETLTYISFDDLIYDLLGLQMMTHLKKLGIEEVHENSDVSKLLASLAKLEDLHHLILRGFRFRSIPCLDELGILRRLRKLKLDGCLASLPSADVFPPGLSYVKLVNSRLGEDPMPVLEKLPMLEHLKLRNAYTGRQMVISRRGFPWLHILCIEELWNLRSVQVGEDAMPRLREFEIKNCPYLETLIKDIMSRTHLTKVKMVTTKNIATKIRNSDLIANVSVVDINP